MKKYAWFLIISLVGLLNSKAVCAQNYLQVVTFEEQKGNMAIFTTAGTSDKKKDIHENAIQSLFYTLFYTGVAGINDGKPYITNDKPEFISQFLNSRYHFFVKVQGEISPATKVGKLYQGVIKVEVPIQSLINDLIRNKLMDAPVKKLTYSDIESTENQVLPTIIVVPYKKEGESFEAILQSDYDRRVAVSKVQSGFESRSITTVDLEAKIAAARRRSEYDANSADSNDKQLLMTSGADVYVTVDLSKDIASEGSRVSLILKAYETSSGSILSSQNAWSKRFNTKATDMLCSYAVQDNLPAFLDDICKNFSKQSNNGKRVVLHFSIDGSSSTSMNDQVGANNYSISNVIRQWVRKNAHQGKFHLQGMVDESIIFDYVMIPPKDKDGVLMDAAEFGFLIESYLKEDVGVPCSSRIDGNTIYITIQ